MVQFKGQFKLMACVTGLLLFSPALLLHAQQPVETKIVVHARAADAKFVGTSMGGVNITIIDTESGKILDEGLTRGTTGDTFTLMQRPETRYMELTDEEAAKYTATLNLEEPKLVTVKATGPMAQPQSKVSVSKQLWVIPGKHIEGNGVILELPGFAVDILTPAVHSSVKPVEDGIPVRANIVMMCGCPTSDGGLWDSSKFEIKALIKKNGEKSGSFPLQFTGTSSLFEGAFKPNEPGVYELTVYAFDPRTGNAGVDKTTVFVR